MSIETLASRIEIREIDNIDFTPATVPFVVIRDEVGDEVLAGAVRNGVAKLIIDEGTEHQKYAGINVEVSGSNDEMKTQIATAIAASELAYLVDASLPAPVVVDSNEDDFYQID